MALATPAMRLASSSPFLPRLLSPTLFSGSRIQLHIRQFALPLFPSLSLAVPIGFQLSLPSIPSILEDIWESILKAVPKKKTSHMKKRHRQMAGKALKDVNSLCKCPACGEIKRMHYLCPHCAKSRRHTPLDGDCLRANHGNRAKRDDEQGSEREDRLKESARSGRGDGSCMRRQGGYAGERSDICIALGLCIKNRRNVVYMYCNNINGTKYFGVAAVGLLNMALPSNRNKFRAHYRMKMGNSPILNNGLKTRFGPSRVFPASAFGRQAGHCPVRL